MENRVCVLTLFCVPLLAAFLLAGCDHPETVVEAPVRAETVRMLDADSVLQVGEEREIPFEVLPESATGYRLGWTAEPDDMVSLGKDGKVKGLRRGTVTVTATLYVDDEPVCRDHAELSVLPKGAFDDSADPLLLFDALKGRPVGTGGWADYANEGNGISYTDPLAPILVCDEKFPDPIAKLEAFADALSKKEPTFIVVSGDVDLSGGRITADSLPPENVPMSQRRFDVNADTVIVGINDARLMYGGLRMDGRPGGSRSPISNVIIRNITIWDSIDFGLGLDALLVRGATGVWINHVRFTSGDRRPGNVGRPDSDRWHDDTLNIREGQVTVSWSEFYNLDRTMISGSDDTETHREDRRTTLHHNFFHKVNQRVPRTRGVQMHLYNNYFTEAGIYVIGPGVNAAFVAQNNLFDTRGTRGIVDFSFPNAGAVVWSSGNEAGRGISGVTNGRISTRAADLDKPWQPEDFYGYVMADDVAGLRTLLPERAGPTLSRIVDFLEGLED